MELKTPTPLQSEHQALHAEIATAAKLGDRTGKASRLVARLIERHFAKEEEFALPPLGLLPALAEGMIEPQMAAAITLAAKLHDQLPDLLAEQRVIIAALEELMTAAESEGHAELVGFAEKLMLHEEIERQVSYPTAILIGKYLQLRLKT
jgi:nitroreductase